MVQKERTHKRKEVASLDTKSAERVYWDNIKGFLILLVVLGHLLECFPDGRKDSLYKLIYVFHMPLFVFCSGYLGRYSPRKILKGLLLPYLVLQLSYCVFTLNEVQITTPVWILWYLPALAVWRMLLPFLEECHGRARLLVVAALVACACLAGFDNTIGYYAVLSRIIVFFPYFAAGYYLKRYVQDRGREGMASWLYGRRMEPVLRLFMALFFLLVSGVFLYFTPHVKAEWLYGAYSYQSGGYSLWFRSAQYLMAAVFGSAVLVFMPKKRTLFTMFGQKSLPIYLSHGVAVDTLKPVLSEAVSATALRYAASAAFALAFCGSISVVAKKVRFF